ncbi:BTAD domain-containing putative transcriptional regulator, partial [Amycolatopsis magusensis]
LWRGPALADVSETLRAAELPRLEEIHMAAVEGRIAAELALGQHLRAVPDLVGLVARYPLRERLRAQLV